MTYRPRRTLAVLAPLTLAALLAPLAVTASPEPAASPSGSAAPVSLVPEDGSLSIGYSDATFLGRLPLVLAEARGYLGEAGFTDVRMVEAQEPLPGVLNGSLDLAILDARQAADAFALGLPVRAVAGYRVAAVPAAPATSASPVASASPAASSPMPSSPWVALDIVVAGTDTLAMRPGTVAAFTLAHARALQDLRARSEGSGPTMSPAPSLAGAPAASAGSSQAPVGDPILEAAAQAGLDVPPDVLASWPAALAAYLPFDGGFDDPAMGDGLGSLRNLYLADPGSMPDLVSFVAPSTLHAAQQALGLSANPPGAGMGPLAASPSPSVAPAP